MKFRRCSNKQKLARCTLHKIWINFCQTCILPTVNNFKCVSSIDLEHLRLTPASNCLKPIQTLQNDFYCHLLSLNWMTNYLNTQPYINKLSRSFPLNFPISSGSIHFFSFLFFFFVFFCRLHWIQWCHESKHESFIHQDMQDNFISTSPSMLALLGPKWS